MLCKFLKKGHGQMLVEEVVEKAEGQFFRPNKLIQLICVVAEALPAPVVRLQA